VLTSHGYLAENASSYYGQPLYGGDGGVVFNSTVPQYMSTLTTQFNAQRDIDGPFRVLWLPTPDFYQQALAYTSPDVFNLNGLSNQNLHNTLIQTLSEMENQSGPSNGQFGSAVSVFGYQYIVVLNDINQVEGGNQLYPIGFDGYAGLDTALHGNPTLFNRFMSNQQDLREVASTYDYTVYQNLAIPGGAYATFWLSSQSSANESSPAESAAIGSVSIVSMSPAASPAEYVLKVNTSRPAWLVFDQNFDPGWTAHLQDGVQINHSEALGWANAFFISSSGVHTIVLNYQAQFSLNLTLFSWLLGTIIVCALSVRTIRVFLLRLLRPSSSKSSKANVDGG
jgi:hypothetical protein